MNKVGKMKLVAFALVTAATTLLSAFAAGPWTGKKVSVLGDSYSTFAGVSGDPANDSLPAGDSAGCREYENNPFYPGDVSILESQTWWRQVLASLGGTLERNNSVGGSEITRDAGGSVGIPVDGRNLIRSFVHRAANGALGNPDVILVLGGTNDGWHGLDASSFETGVATLFSALKSDYPNAQVVVLVPAQENDSARIAGISADLRAVLLNGAAGSGFLSVDLDEVGFVADDFKYGHPKASGMTKIADKVIAAVNAAPTFYKTLETDGRGYILTDYQPKTSRSRIEYDLRFLYLGLSVGLGIANGTSSSGAANAYEWGGFFNAETRTFAYYTEPGGAGAKFGAGFCDTSVRHTIAMGQGKVTLDDQTTSIATPAEDYTTGGKFALFAVNYGGTTFSSRAIVRVAGIRVFEGDTVVRSWVPAKDANGTATLYDLVNKKFETVKAGVFAVDDTADPTWAAQVANGWTVQPSVPSSIVAGTLPTISLGTAKCGNGTQTATYAAKDIQNLPAGTYTQVVEVVNTAGYRGLREELTFTVTGTVPTAASVAPRALAPLGGASVATHTAKQKEFIGLPAAQRKRVLAVLYERERAEYAANDGHPQPVRLQWNGGDGECTVKVYRGNETTPVQTHVVVTRWTDGNFFDLDNLEVGQAYRWTVSNAKGTAEGSFVTESETPRLFNAGIIGNTRDLGGSVGMDGRRVRQGMFLRSRCFDTNNKKTYASVLTATEEAFFRDFIGLKTEIDLRGETWITQSFVPGVTTRVNTAWPLDYTGAYLTDATKKSAMKAALNPIFDAAKYPIDVHCHSGQDRTGMYCFILEALLGVSEEDCIRDWEWSALGNSAFNTGDTYQLDSFLSKFRTLVGATTQAKAETFMKWLGYTDGQIKTFRDIMLEPVEPTHVHTPVAVPAVAATYATPGRTAGTKCSECGEVLSAGEVIPVIASCPTCSATVAADGKAKLAFANVLAPVVVSVVYGDEDRGEEYFRDADWDSDEEPYGWDHWEVVAFVPAGTTSFEDYAIPGWGTTATHARFLMTPYEQTPKATLETIVATDPATQILDTGFSPNGGTRLNLTMKLGVDPANKTLVDTPSDAAGALAYGIAFDASRHPVYAYDTATYAVNAAAANGTDVRFYMNLDEPNRTGWRTKIGNTTCFASGKPSAPSAKTTDGTMRIYGLGSFSAITIADAQGVTQAFFAPVTGFDAGGNEVVGFLDTVSMKMRMSSGSAAFAKGTAHADYHKNLLEKVLMLKATATIDFREPEPPVPENGFPVTVTVKDWTGKTVTTVRGVTFDGNFRLDTADHFNGKVDYVTAFDGGTVVKNSVSAERASSSVVTYGGITGALETEVFVQPYVPITPGAKIPDPCGVKDPTKSGVWIYTGTTSTKIKLAKTNSSTTFPALTDDVSNFASGYKNNVWAPEIHYVRDNWYIYFSASDTTSSDRERAFVMSYKGADSSDLDVSTYWSTATRLVTPDDKWAIDGTVFEGGDGKLYYVWSGWAGSSNVRQDIYLAPMATPTSFEMGAKRTLVSMPDQSWETQPTDHPLVEEGPAVLLKGGKTIIVFSGNGSWKQYYSLGYTVCSDGNYTNAPSWKKHVGTVFTHRSHAYGPGHCSFMKDENGNDLIVYHATATATAPIGSDYWSIRDARIQPFAWHDDEPVFGAPCPTAGGSTPTGEAYDLTKSWTKAGSASKVFVHAPTAEMVTGAAGTTVSPTFLWNDCFDVSGTTSLSEPKTVTLTLTLKDASRFAWDDGTAGSKTCLFTAKFETPPEPVVSDYWEGKLKFAPAKTIVCYGDSLTAGTMADTVTISADNYFDGRMNGVSGAESYPYQLAKMIPGEYNVIAQARGSRTTDAIVSWAGGVPVKSVATIALPAEADTEVSAGFPNFLYNGTDPGYMYEHYKDSPSKTEEEKNRYYGLQIPDYALFEANPVAGAPAGDVIPGWFGGVHVQLHHTRANERTISRTEAGAAVTVPAGSAFIPDSVVSLKDSVAVFFAGSNDRSLERKDEVIAMLKDGVANYTRHVVLSPYEEGFLAAGETSYQTTPTGFEREMAAAFEDHYLNLRLELATRGLDLAVALGRMSPAQAAGKTWREGLISSDGVHLSSAGYAVLARLVKEKLQQLEYLPADPEPAYGELFDYLQTDGAGYIRTGVVPNLRTTRVEMTFVLGNSEKDQTFCFASEAVASAAGGTSIPGNGNEFGLAYYAALNFGTKTSPDKHPGFQYYCEGLGEAKFLKDFADTAGKHVFELGGATLKVDGAEIATTGTPNDGTAGGELVLFTTTFGKGLTNFADARIYSIRIYEADALAHDYRPCTDKSGRAGLWDAKTNAVLLPTSDGFVAANDPASAWTQPAEDTPEAVAVALAADGFDAVTQTAISTSAERTPLEAYAAFRTYCVETLGLVDPKDAAKAGVKANALLGYALGAESVPDEAVASGDVEIVSVERDAGAVVVGVAVRGVEPHADKAVQSALDAVLSATGGEKVTAMSAETVSVSGKVQNDALSVTVTPKQTGASSFFVRIVIRNGRTEE